MEKTFLESQHDIFVVCVLRGHRIEDEISDSVENKRRDFWGSTGIWMVFEYF